MKNIWTIMAMAVVFAGCSQEETDSPILAYSLTGYADVDSRTAFGTPGATSIPFKWSAGDYIYAGTNKSNPISNGGSSTTFTFGTKPSATDVYYNISGSSAKEANVKAEQTVGNLGSNGDFGYATSSEGSFTLNHATSYVWFETTLPNDATLESITLDAGSTTISGTATWDGSKFGTISNASSSISLSVINKSISKAALSMVIFPSTITDASVTYNLKINGTTKSYTKIISGSKQIPAGKTWKISTKLFYDNNELYELRVLTFEDEDAKFEAYSFMGGDGENYNISTWSDLIVPEDEQNYAANGNIIYTNYSTPTEYYWEDITNTYLYHEFPENYGTRNYAGGGMVVSSHTVPFEDLEEYTIYDYQVSVTAQSGHNGSRNFCVAYNCSEVDYDAAGLEKNTLSFGDGVARVIDHMYVTIAAPTHYCITYGNSFSTAYGDNDFLKLVATGIKADDTKTEPVEIMLAEGADMKLTDWTKWDLSSLGKIKAVEFHMEEAQFDTWGNASYWRTPMYFAYDDIAVRF